MTTIVLGMDEWIWQYPELHPDPPRVTRLNHTEEIYSPRVAVKENWAAVVAKHNKVSQ